VIFLIVLAYDILVVYNAPGSEFKPLSNNGTEIFLITYVTCYAIEEALKSLTLYSPILTSLKNSVANHVAEMANWVDIVGIVCFFLAMIFGNIDPTTVEDASSMQSAGRILYAVSVMAFFMKILHWFVAGEKVGPQVYMARRMVSKTIVIVLNPSCYQILSTPCVVS
jgi:hypothetical protein